MSIFRNDAIEHQTRRLYGEVVLTSHLPTRIFCAFLFISTLIVTCTILLFPYSESERATGRIAPNKGLVRIVSPLNGHVGKVYINQNDLVAKGQALVDVEQQQALGAGENAIDALQKSIDEEQVEIRIQISSYISEIDIKENSLKDKITKIDLEKSQLETQIGVLSENVVVAESTLARFKKLLDEDAASPTEFATAQSQVLNLKQSKLELLQRRQRLELELNDASYELSQLPLTKENKLASYRRELQGGDSRKTELEIRKGAVVVSPVDGRVAALPIDTGQSVNQTQLLLALIPKGGKLEAELFVSAKSIGHIREGQKVRIFLDAFPFRKYGALKGEVLSISGTILYPKDLSESAGVSGPAYRVKVRLSSETLQIGERAIPLQPGMTVSAMIVQNKRSLWRRLQKRA